VTLLSASLLQESNCETPSFDAHLESEKGWELLPPDVVMLEVNRDDNSSYLIVRYQSNII